MCITYFDYTAIFCFEAASPYVASPGFLKASYADQGGLKPLRDPPDCAFQVLELKVCTTIIDLSCFQ